MNVCELTYCLQQNNNKKRIISISIFLSYPNRSKLIITMHMQICSYAQWSYCFLTSPLPASVVLCLIVHRLRVVPHFFSGIVERAKRERAWKSSHARKGDSRRGDFYARSRFARSTIPEEKWGTTRSLNYTRYLIQWNLDTTNNQGTGKICSL